MVNTKSNDFDEVFRLGSEVKQAVNKLYRLLELDIDGVFRYMLLFKKKKYAAMTIERMKDGSIKNSLELKGLDIVKRDWCQLAADAGRAVINIIMTDKAEDTRLSEIQEHLEGLKTALLEGKVNIKDLEITKQLTKDPSDYPDKKSLAHVQVAMRLNSGGGKKLRAGVEYIICEDGSGLSATQRAYGGEEVRSSTSLKVDTLYYLSQQLLPVVSRLCDPIEVILASHWSILSLLSSDWSILLILASHWSRGWTAPGWPRVSASTPASTRAGPAGRTATRTARPWLGTRTRSGQTHKHSTLFIFAKFF